MPANRDNQASSRHPKANATTWRPGQSGNPNGRPRSLVEIERQIRELHGPHVAEALTIVLDKVREGDMVAARLFFDRVLGPARVASEDVDAETDDQLREACCAAVGITVEELRAVKAARAAAAAKDEEPTE